MRAANSREAPWNISWFKYSFLTYTIKDFVVLILFDPVHYETTNFIRLIAFLFRFFDPENPRNSLGLRGHRRGAKQTNDLNFVCSFLIDPDQFHKTSKQEKPDNSFF